MHDDDIPPVLEFIVPGDGDLRALSLGPSEIEMLKNFLNGVRQGCRQA